MQKRHDPSFFLTSNTGDEKELEWVKNLLIELGIEVKTPMKLSSDKTKQTPLIKLMYNNLIKLTNVTAINNDKRYSY